MAPVKSWTYSWNYNRLENSLKKSSKNDSVEKKIHVKRPASEISEVIFESYVVITQEQKADQKVPETPIAPNEALEDHMDEEVVPTKPEAKSIG